MPFGASAAAVVCSREWTPMCDDIQHRADVIMPWMVGVLFVLSIALALCIIREVCSRRPAEPRAAQELEHRLGPDAEF